MPRLARRLIAPLAATAVWLGVAAGAHADPVHAHCRIELDWTRTINNPPGTSTTEGTTIILTYANILLPVVPPLGTPNCMYETSDITQIDVTLDLGLPGALDLMVDRVFAQSGSGGATEFNPVPMGPYTFRHNMPTSILFPAHEGGGVAFHVQLPNDTISLVLRGLSRDVIPPARLDLTGNHYYLVPEPATLFLLGSGLAGIAVRRRRNARARH